VRGAADHGQQAADLFARDQAELPASRTGEDGPVGIVGFAHLAGVFQHENGSRLHLFGDPLAEDTEFSDHMPSFRTIQEALLRRLLG